MINSASNVIRNMRDGIFLFKQKDYYASHEYFKDTWREATYDSREFFCALFHISATHFRLSQDRPTAVKKFFHRAQYWLKALSEDHLGFTLRNLRSNLNQLINAINQVVPPGCILEKFFQPFHSNITSIKEDE